MKKIAVIGAGTMGLGIAQTLAQYNFEVRLFDVSVDALNKSMGSISHSLDRLIKKEVIAQSEKEAILNRIIIDGNLQNAVKAADVIIEAATENKPLKLNLFKELSSHSRPDTILASNTSSISITELAAVTSRPDKVIGMHFMNPVPVMQLVEVIKGYLTSKETVSSILLLTNQVHKTAVQSRDYPGFIANRILMPMINEAVYTLFEGIAGVQEIDQVMKLGMAHPMGPLQLADFIGLDVCHAVLIVLFDGFKNPKYAPCPLLVNMVHAGSLGVKSGNGFYSYTGSDKTLTIAEQFRKNHNGA